MSRRAGARAVYTPSKDLRELIAGMDDRVGDPTPVNHQIALDAAEEVRSRLEQGGDGDWPGQPLSTIGRWGSHPVGNLTGGFAPTIRAFWDARGAGWLTRAPHAHLFDQGAATHHDDAGARVNVFNEKGHHVSRQESRSRLRSTTAREHQPPRPFAYLSDALIERSGERVLDFFLAGTVE